MEVVPLGKSEFGVHTWYSTQPDEEKCRLFRIFRALFKHEPRIGFDSFQRGICPVENIVVREIEIFLGVSTLLLSNVQSSKGSNEMGVQ